MLGPEVPAWEALRNALSELVGATGAASACVLDESNDLWCAAPPSRAVSEGAERFYERELAGARSTALRRGGKLELVRSHPAPEASYVAESFAGIYVLLVSFDGEFDPFGVRRAVLAALPRIEALTLALPPPEGPTAGEGASAKRG